MLREIGHLATIPIFWSKKVQIIGHEWTPEIYKIKLYCTVIILYRMETKPPQKTNPSQSSCNRLTLLLFPMCTKQRARYQNSDPPNQRNKSRLASRSNCTHLKEISPPPPNITYILIIHSGPVAKTVPIKNHGQDLSTSQLKSIRCKYLRLK